MITLLLFCSGWKSGLIAQSGSCDPATPFFNVDLSANPNSSWTSTPVARIDHCCGVTGTSRCVEFLVTLAPSAVAINFDVASGANPPGWFYQVNCGPQIPMGTPICINGPGPYTITFCKPGSNLNTYKVTSIGGPTGSPDETIGNGCNTTMSISGVVNSSITWNSIFPGATGTYNSYLSCTSACSSTIVTSQPGHPPYVDYQVCGATIAIPPCVSAGTFCDTIRVYMSTPLLNTVNPSPASFCLNNPSVLLTGTVNGGIPPYTYAWTNAANGGGTVVGTGLTYVSTAIGTYSFIVYDQNYPACPAPITNVTVTSSPIPTVNAGPDQTICGSLITNAMLNGTVTGATGGIWSGGSGAFSPGNTTLNATYIPTLAELASGTVILTLTSTGNGACSAVSDQLILHVSTPLSLTIGSPPVICYGQTATITANVTGGVPPYSYLWNTGETTQSISNVLPGTHSVTVTGGSPGFCTATASITISSNPQIIITTSPNNAISCSVTATISASASGGTGSLGYLWSNGATTSSSNVNTGTYIITVTDAMGCSANNSVSVTASSSLTATVNQPPVLCNGAVALLTATVTGGLGGNSFLWNTGATTTNISVGAGNYCATVTDAGGCIASACVTLTQNPPLTVSIPTPAIICNGASTAVNATASGGQPPYTFLWNTGQTSPSLIAPAGTYTVTVTDFAACVNTATVTISEAPLINIVLSSVGAGCFGGNNGSATATVSGGVPTYFYSWSPYGGSSAIASGLLAGTYTLAVTDTKGCSLASTIVVSEPIALSATVTVQNPVSCNGGSNGAAIVNPTGGTPTYSYVWSPIGGTVQNPANLAAGSYTATVTDINGCIKTVQTTITEPPILTANIVSTTNVSCNGGSTGSATISATGGSPGYTYSWAPTGGTNATATNLAAGTYTVTIADLKACSTQLTILINQPPLVTSLISGTDLTCFGGSNGTATVAPSGGTGPYTYVWNTSPMQTTATATNLSAGTYSVTVTDFMNCSTTSPTVAISSPPALVATASPSSLISCNSSIAISSSATGGTGAYTYLWNTGATTSGINVNTGNYIITITDVAGCTSSDSVSVLASNSTLAATINQPANICFGTTTPITVSVTGGLGGNTYLWNTGETTSSITKGAGSYCVTVIDIGGCITSACVTITQNPLISVTIATPQNVCIGGTATITAIGSGGQPPYSYLWNSLETTQSIVKPAGTYSVTLSDITGNSCAGSANATISEEAPITATMSSTNISCFGASNGTALVYASGGSPGYSYSWAPSGGTNTSATQLGPGSYTVTVLDSLGCTKTGNVIITQPATTVAIALTGTDNLCFGDSTGTATAAGSGGTSPYFYYWSPNGDTLAGITGLIAGTYTGTVADNTGCLSTSSLAITEPPDLTITSVPLQITCFGGTGSVGLFVTGGTGTLIISGSDTTNLAAGTYNYTVTDANLCSKTTQAIINPAPPALLLNATATQINCFGGTGSVLLTASGGTGTLVISGDATTNLAAGIYNYTVTDSTGCTANASATINSVSAVTLTAIPSQIKCYGGTGSIALQAAGGTGTLITTGDDTVNLATGSYNYTVTDANGCFANATANINFGPSEITLSDTTVASTCGLSNGSATVSASGGTGSYTYSWSPSGGTDATAINLLAANYTVSVTDSNGCQNQLPLTVSSASFLIANFNNTDVCFNDSTIFSDSSTTSPGSSISSWNWDFGDFSATNSSQNPGYVYMAPGIYNVSLTVMSSDGCISSISRPATVHFLPSVNFLSTNVCLNSSTLFTDISTVPTGDSINTWLWNFGDSSASGTISNPQHVYSLPGTYSIVLLVTTNYGCTDTVSKTAIVYPPPIAQFKVDDSSGCVILCPHFTDMSDPLIGTIASWQWDYGDGSQLGTTPNEEHCYANSGLYNVSLSITTSDGCSSSITQNNLINVYQAPLAEFNYSPKPPTSLTSEIYFNNLSVGSSAWSWNFGDANDSTGSSLQFPTHTYSDVGNFCITLIARNNFQCIDSVIHCLEIDPEFTFFIPNAFTPSESSGTNDLFSGYGTNINQYDMWIFDRWGNMIFHTNDLLKGWDGRANRGKEIAQRDVYVYLVELTDFKGNKHQYRGIVTLVR